MDPNAGDTDRTARVVLGVLALLSPGAVVVYGGGLPGDLQLVVAGATLVFATVMFVTVGVRRCPVNALRGRNPCHGRE
jgi:hypothetical protein